MERYFVDRKAFRDWLYDNHDSHQGIHVVFTKGETLSYEEALEEALCFGWIDGVVYKLDDKRYTRYFTKRTKNSNWSEKNKKTMLMLLEKGLVTKAGLLAIEKAKKNGMWDKKELNTVTDEMFSYFCDVISSSPLAKTNFDKMSASVRKTYVLFYLDAKTEKGRATRLTKIINRLENNLRPI